MERAGRLIPKLKMSPEIAGPETRARAAWKLAAGETVARHTKPGALVRGALIIEVEDPQWQRNLARMEHFFVRNLREALGEAIVQRLDFRPMRKPVQNAAPEAVERRPPQREERIADPVLNLVYRQSLPK